LNLLRYKEKTLHAQTLCNDQLRRDKVSLNKISTDAACELIQKALDEKVNLRKVFVDTVGPAENYQRMLTEHFKNYNIEFKVAPKADSLFACVSAASIVAKVTRDKTLENWQFEESKFIEIDNDNEKNYKLSIKFGSGYPGDPKTKKWLTENVDLVFGYPNVVRFSWSTTNNNLKANGAFPIKW
jgi:ribonuclease H2 subunit A